MSRKGDGIDTPAGMTGKTYSTWESPIELATLETVVNEDGGDFSKVKLIPNDITDEPAALAAHQTDAIWVFYGWGGINAKQENTDCDFFFFKDINPVFDYYTPVIIANQDTLEQKPEMVITEQNRSRDWLYSQGELRQKIHRQIMGEKTEV